VQDAGLTLTAAECLGSIEDIARLAEEAGAKEKQRALAAAAYNGRLDAIDATIALGADPNAPNVGLNPNATALHNAVCDGSLAAVQKLVEAGASVDTVDGPYRLHRSGGRSISSGRAAPTRSSTSGGRAPRPSSTPKSPSIFAVSRIARNLAAASPEAKKTRGTTRLCHLWTPTYTADNPQNRANPLAP
jgi:hypothetical protein